MSTLHKHAEVLRAIAEEKEVEGRLNSNYDWLPAVRFSNPLTHPHFEWRIVPEKKVLRYRVAKFGDNTGERWLETAYVNIDIAAFESSPSFIEWLHDWQEVEVE